jgi:hypothetical protein
VPLIKFAIQKKKNGSNPSTSEGSRWVTAYPNYEIFKKKLQPDVLDSRRV